VPAAELPVSIHRLVRLLVEEVGATRVRLYGSRARGDHQPKSDFDLAVDFPPERTSDWRRFLADFDDRPITLQQVDLLDMNRCPPSLRMAVDTEGIVLYESTHHV
jgi:predicted nucleotidyltransferase